MNFLSISFVCFWKILLLGGTGKDGNRKLTRWLSKVSTCHQHLLGKKLFGKRFSRQFPLIKFKILTQYTFFNFLYLFTFSCFGEKLVAYSSLHPATTLLPLLVHVLRFERSLALVGCHSAGICITSFIDTSFFLSYWLH